MNTQLFFIFDTHCPWSYATLPLVNKIAEHFDEMNIHLLHCARYEGDENISKKTLNDVEELSLTTFTSKYTDALSIAKDSTLTANFVSWITNKVPREALKVVNALMKAHFKEGNQLTSQDSVASLVSEYKLSPPTKVFSLEKLTRNAEIVLSEIIELQEIIETEAIPALLLAIDDKLILLNHNLYLADHNAIIDAVKLELA